jgi:hypothetical protein
VVIGTVVVVVVLVVVLGVDVVVDVSVDVDVPESVAPAELVVVVGVGVPVASSACAAGAVATSAAIVNTAASALTVRCRSLPMVLIVSPAVLSAWRRLRVGAVARLIVAGASPMGRGVRHIFDALPPERVVSP